MNFCQNWNVWSIISYFEANTIHLLPTEFRTGLNLMVNEVEHDFIKILNLRFWNLMGEGGREKEGGGKLVLLGNCLQSDRATMWHSFTIGWRILRNIGKYWIDESENRGVMELTGPPISFHTSAGLNPLDL